METSTPPISHSDLEARLYFAAVALVFYDYFLTFPDEVRYLWKAKQSSTVFLVHGLRYIALSCAIVIIVSTQLYQGCVAILRIQMAISIAIFLDAALFAALRIYAIYDLSRWRFAIILVIGLLNPIFLLYSYIHIEVENTLDFGRMCIYTASPVDLAAWRKWTLASRVASLAFDIIIVTLTYAKLQGAFRDRRPLGQLRVTLVRDTILYFGLLLPVNIIGIAVGHIDGLILPMSTWIEALTCILLPRLLLDLRAVSAGRMRVALSSTFLSVVNDTLEDQMTPEAYKEEEKEEHDEGDTYVDLADVSITNDIEV